MKLDRFVTHHSTDRVTQFAKDISAIVQNGDQLFIDNFKANQLGRFRLAFLIFCLFTKALFVCLMLQCPQTQGLATEPTGQP